MSFGVALVGRLRCGFARGSRAGAWWGDRDFAAFGGWPCSTKAPGGEGFETGAGAAVVVPAAVGAGGPVVVVGGELTVGVVAVAVGVVVVVVEVVVEVPVEVVAEVVVEVVVVGSEQLPSPAGFVVVATDSGHGVRGAAPAPPGVTSAAVSPPAAAMTSTMSRRATIRRTTRHDRRRHGRMPPFYRQNAFCIYTSGRAGQTKCPGARPKLKSNVRGRR